MKAGPWSSRLLFFERTPENTLPPCSHTPRKSPVTHSRTVAVWKLGQNSQQRLNKAEPSPWTSSLSNCEKINLFLSHPAAELPNTPIEKLQDSGPQPSWHQRLVSRKTIFPWTWRVEAWFQVIRAHYIYCALHLFYYYINSTSDHESLEPEGWGHLL